MRYVLSVTVLCTLSLLASAFPTDPSGEQELKKPGTPVKPQAEKPRPSFMAKPTPLLGEHGSAPTNNFIMDAAHSISTSEIPVPGEGPELLAAPAPIPSAQLPEMLTSAVQVSDKPADHDPILETASPIPAAEALVQDAIPGESPAVPEAAAVPSRPAELEHLQVDSISNSAAAAAAPAVEVADAGEVTASNSKSRRHAGGVEAPISPRIGDFEDVEVDSGSAAPEYPATHEQAEVTPELSKEEMILMAMDQAHYNKVNRPQVGRPSHLGSKPTYQYGGFSEDDEEENDSTVDLRNGSEPATIVQEPSTVSHKPKDPSKSTVMSADHPHPYGSSTGNRNKPRPYGMDKPSKSRPTLDSGIKDKNEHFGLPHSSSDYVHKGEHSGSSSSTVSYLGFQIPSIKWPSFTDFFPNLWQSTSRNREFGMGKSDAEAACEEDEGEHDSGVRSPVISAGALCQSSSVTNNCDKVCIDKGFASGTCMGPYPAPGCMCKRPGASANVASKDLGILYTPFVEKEQAPAKDLTTSVSAPCKKCACIDACKKAGSFTGMCAEDRCYCGVPYFHKKVE